MYHYESQVKCGIDHVKIILDYLFCDWLYDLGIYWLI